VPPERLGQLGQLVSKALQEQQERPVQLALQVLRGQPVLLVRLAQQEQPVFQAQTEIDILPHHLLH
jgi:hypothetical protein